MPRQPARAVNQYICAAPEPHGVQRDERFIVCSPSGKNKNVYEFYVKRIIDLTLSGAMSFILLPFIIVIAVVIKLQKTGPILFVQDRPGKDGKPFKLYKFRTMNNVYNNNGKMEPDENRITHLGNALRRLSLDEIPQLYNVIIGDMSMVGPRPLLMQYLDRYTPNQARRMEVKPGITGWSQVRGRNDLCWEDKFELDEWYVDNFSLKYDLLILIKTIEIVLTKKGICQVGHVTMPEFKGSNEKPRPRRYYD